MKLLLQNIGSKIRLSEPLQAAIKSEFNLEKAKYRTKVQLGVVS